jgi:hypothetical protein
MGRKILPDGIVHRTGLRNWFEQTYGYRPGWYTISEAIRQGMPCEPHPLLEGKLLFDTARVFEWIEARRKRPIQPQTLRAAISR